MADATVIVKSVLLLLTLLYTVEISRSAGCGPLGYKATELLKPAYWYFDLNKTECAQFPKPAKYDILTPVNDTQHVCRFYFHICEAMKYQCAGTACLRFLRTDDYVVLLGYEKENPFFEGSSHFQSSFIGDNSLCDNSQANIRTNLQFSCDLNATWNTTKVHDHGGSLSPKPVALKFDKKTCKLDVNFNYEGACEKFPAGETPGKNISVGSILLILFFPGLVLYFVIGILINRMGGHHGTEMIPHVTFWLSLPDLIMDGFAFTMATLTCRTEEARTNYESV